MAYGDYAASARCCRSRVANLSRSSNRINPYYDALKPRARKRAHGKSSGLLGKNWGITMTHDDRFRALSALASIVGLISTLAVLAGLAIAFMALPGTPQIPFLQAARETQELTGIALALFGLSGLMFSGAIRVLVAIERNTRTLVRNS
jgi:hypothetical protein